MNINTDKSYLLLSVFHKNTNFCGTYYKGEDGEFITSLLTGEKFYNLRDFVISIKGLGTIDEWDTCYFDEEEQYWFPLIHLRF
jgi:hypothetical protein